MFDIGWTELLVIGTVALIVVGPRDLPGMFRTLGRFTGKARAMARDFQRAMDRAADEAGMKDVKDIGNTLRKATSPRAMGADALKDAAKSLSGVSDDAGGGETATPARAEMTAERAEAAEKIRASAARKASERLEAEAEAAPAEAGAAPEPATPEPATPEPADGAETSPKDSGT